MLLFAIACQSVEADKPTGKQLLDTYYQVTCELMMDDTCAHFLGDCGYPISPYSDIADCLNSHLVSHQHCSNLEQEVEAETEVMEDCLIELQPEECAANTVCPNDIPILRAGQCEQVLELFAQHCNGFSW